MKIISLINQKGGCGKTTTAVNLAAALSRLNKKVLLLDLDPQAHTTVYLGKDPDSYSLTSLSIFDYYLGKKTTFELADLVVPIEKNLDLIPSNISLSALEQETTGSTNRMTVLDHFLAVDNKFSYDYVIIDCPPNLGVLTFNALLASNQIIIPIDISTFALRALKNLDKMFFLVKKHKKRTPMASYLLTMYDARPRYARIFIEDAKKQLGSGLLNTIIRLNVKLKEACQLGQHIYQYDPLAYGSVDYLKLARELTKENAGTAEKATITQPAVPERTEEEAIQMFSYNFADAKEVFVVGDFNNWEVNNRYQLTNKDGRWLVTVPLRKGEYKYKFVVDGKWMADPSNPFAEDDSYGGKNSIVKIN